MVELKNVKITISQRIEKMCFNNVHEYCTQSRNPPIIQCLNCGEVVTDLSNFTEKDFDKIDALDERLRQGKLDLYR